MKVKPVSVSIAYDGAPGGRPIVHTVLVDSDGNVHERFQDDPPGEWNTWPRRVLPNRKPQRASKRRRR